MTLHIGVKAAVDGSETCTADRLDDCASVVVRAVGIGLLFVEHWFVEDALFREYLRACCGDPNQKFAVTLTLSEKPSQSARS